MGRWSILLASALLVAVCVRGHEGGHEGHDHFHQSDHAMPRNVEEAGVVEGGGTGGGGTPAQNPDVMFEVGNGEDDGIKARQEAWSKCDRKRSRQARAILNKEIYPVLQNKGYEFPSDCPLNKKNDMYLDNELHKKEVRYANWKCTYCQKVFKGEAFLEQHFQNRHPYTVMRDGSCLGDFCDVLECDLSLDAAEYANARMGCNPKSMQRRRHRCHAVLDKCFPPDRSTLANELHHAFEGMYCSHLSCDGASGVMQKAAVPEVLRQALGKRSSGNNRDDARNGGWKKLWIVFGVLFVIVLIIFYLGMCLYRRDISIVDDLRKLSNNKRKMRMELLKSKNY